VESNFSVVSTVPADYRAGCNALRRKASTSVGLGNHHAAKARRASGTLLAVAEEMKQAVLIAISAKRQFERALTERTRSDSIPVPTRSHSPHGKVVKDLLAVLCAQRAGYSESECSISRDRK